MAPGERLEFRASGEDTSSVIGPSIGIGILSAMGAAIGFGILIAIVGIVVDLPEDPTIAIMMIASVFVGYRMAVRFVRWRGRVSRERMLVLEDAGITYFAYADKSELTRWEEIEDVHEVESSQDGEPSYRLVFHRRGKRDWRFGGDEFIGYRELKAALAHRLPGRTRYVA